MSTAVKVLKITKPDKTVHVVPVTHKAFYLHQNNVILGPSEQWKIEEITEDEAANLPLVDETFITPLEATAEVGSLKKQNETLAARIKELEDQARGVVPMGHGQNQPVGRVGGDPATATEGGEAAGKSFVPVAPAHVAAASAEATSRALTEQNTGVTVARKEYDKTADEVIALVKEAGSITAVEDLVKGDDRKTVKDAADKRITQLKEAQ